MSAEAAAMAATIASSSQPTQAIYGNAPTNLFDVLCVGLVALAIVIAFGLAAGRWRR